MADYSVTYQMAFKNQEWGYIFYKAGTSAAQLVADELESTFDTSLLAMHGNGVELAYIAAANVDGLGRDTRRKYSHNTYVDRTDHNADVTNNSGIFSLFGGANGDRKLTLSGLPDIFIQRDFAGNAIKNALFAAAFAGFRPALLAQAFAIKRVDVATGTGAGAWKNVRLMEPDMISFGVPVVTEEDASYTKFTLSDPAHDLVVGDDVVFSRGEIVREVAGLGGVFKVAKATANIILLNTRYWPRPSTYAPRDLRVRKAGYVLDPITEIEFDDWGTRQRGEGGGPKGRASGASMRH